MLADVGQMLILFPDARVVFETAVNKLAQKPETVARAKPIYAFFHDFESRYGELSQITKLEKRMRDLFPEDPMLTLFSRRFLQQGFDPTAIRPIISPATQARPRAIPSIETPPSAQKTPPRRFAPPTSSPKRPMPFEEPDPEATRPRKLARGESPLKGAAGRRLDQQKRNRQPNELSQYDGLAQSQLPPPPLLPRDVLFLLSIIPKAETYHATRFKPEEMVRLIRETDIPSTAAQLRLPPGGVGLPPIHQMAQMSQMPQIPQIPQGHYNGGSSKSYSLIKRPTGHYAPAGHYINDVSREACNIPPKPKRRRKKPAKHNMRCQPPHKDGEILGLPHVNEDQTSRPSSQIPRALRHINLLSSISPDDVAAMIKQHEG